MIRFKYIVLILFIALQVSCDFLNLNRQINNEEMVASVGDAHLYKSDLAHLYLLNDTKKDSLLITNNFIESWARKQILFQKANLNLSDEKQEELRKMLLDYKENLYINSYKDALVSQNLDSIISEEGIHDFYFKNKNIFRLKETIFQVKYYRFKNRAKNISKIKKNFYKYSITQLDSIYEDDLNFEIKQVTENDWLTLNEFISTHVIFKDVLKEAYLKKGFFKEIKKNNYIYFFKILDIKKRGEIAPLEEVKPIVKQMIVHQKKLEYIKELDKRLIEEAIQNKSFIKY